MARVWAPHVRSPTRLRPSQCDVYCVVPGAAASGSLYQILPACTRTPSTPPAGLAELPLASPDWLVASKRRPHCRALVGLDLPPAV